MEVSKSKVMKIGIGTAKIYSRSEPQGHGNNLRSNILKNEKSMGAKFL